MSVASASPHATNQPHVPTLDSSGVVIEMRLHYYSPQQVAEELSLMDAQLLRRISPKELENGAWMKKDKIAQKCYQLNNLNSLKAILAGLQCTPVYRLKRTWKEVSAKRRKKFHMLSALMSEEHNWKIYNRHLESILDGNTPCIPFLGVLLTMIVQYDSVRAVRNMSSRYRRPSKAKKVSGVEDYTVLEAITVRTRLESIRKRSSSWRMSVSLETEVPSRHSKMHVGLDRMATIQNFENVRPRANAIILEQEDSDSDSNCKVTADKTILKSESDAVCDSWEKMTSPVSLFSPLSSEHPSDFSASDDGEDFEPEELLHDDQLKDITNTTELRSRDLAPIKPQVIVSQINVQLLSGRDSGSVSTLDDGSPTVEETFRIESIPHTCIENTASKLTDTELRPKSQASSEQSSEQQGTEQQGMESECEVTLCFSSDNDLYGDSDVNDKPAVRPIDQHLLNPVSGIRLVPSRSYDGLTNWSQFDKLENSISPISKLETGSLSNLYDHSLSAIIRKETPIRVNRATTEDNTSSKTIGDNSIADAHRTHPSCLNSPLELDRPPMKRRSKIVNEIHDQSHLPHTDSPTPSQGTMSPLTMRSRSKGVNTRFNTNSPSSDTTSLAKKILKFIIPNNALHRRRPSDLIAISQASTSNLSDPSTLLVRYQLMSLGCSFNIQSNKNVREILTQSPRNTEMQNYKLSYLRELASE